MSEKDRMRKLLDASAETLARVDEILDGKKKNTNLLTFADAARKLGLSRPTVNKLALNGVLATRYISNKRRITEQSVLDYIDGKVAAA